VWQRATSQVRRWNSVFEPVFVDRRRLDLFVAPDVLERRRVAWQRPAKPNHGWYRIVAEQVSHADEGCNLAVLQATTA
jgi:hypothetical protein